MRADEDAVSVRVCPTVERPNGGNTQAVFADFEFDGLVVQFFFCEFGCNLWNAHMNNSDSEKRGEWPNDLKLSDRGGLAADVPVGSAGLPHSGCQTGAVRCSAWLGCGYWSFTVTIPSVTNFGMTRHEYPLEKVPTYIWLPVAQEVLRLAGRSEEKQRQLMYDLAAQVAPAQRTHEG